MPNMTSFEFEVGGRYRNRRGEYEVLSIDHPVMQIRYDNGDIASVDVVTQRRIYSNIQEEVQGEEQVRQQAEAKAAARLAARTTRAAARRSSPPDE